MNRRSNGFRLVGPRQKRPRGAASAAVLGMLLLAGCSEFPRYLDPWATDGRDGGGAVITYPALMRIAAAAQAGGDLPAAVGMFRRAAQMNSDAAAPLVGVGNALLELGQVNEAI